MVSDPSHRLFVHAPFYMVRAPVLPIEDFELLSCDENLKENLFTLFKKNSYIREAIMIASPELYKNLKDLAKKSDKQKLDIASSLLRYLLRMVSRSTPFGLFSFVALGKWAESTKCEFDHQKLKKRARPDMEWLFQIINLICENPDNLPRVPLHTNPLLTISSDRIHLNYFQKSNLKEKKSGISIRANPLTKAILRIANTPLSITQLQEKILEEFPSLDLVKTRTVIEQLLAQEFLQFSLTPSLLTNSPYNDLLKKIDRYQLKFQSLSYLEAIDKELIRYEEGFVNDAENLVQNLYQYAEQVLPSKNYLQVDLGAVQEEFLLPEKIATEIGEAAEVFFQLSKVLTGHQKDPLKSYRDKFIEKYGFSRCIPLLELLDPQELGLPELYLQEPSVSEFSDSEEFRWEEWLKTQYCLCMQTHNQEIILDQKIIDQLVKEKPALEKAPLSFDLFCQIIAESSKKIDAGEYELCLLGSNLEGGSTFGRFLDLLGSQAIQEIKEFYHVEEQLTPHSISVQTSYIPGGPRGANVAIHPNLRKCYLDLTNGAPPGLSLHDIYVGADKDRFYLSNKMGDLDWIFRAGNVLNNELSPFPLRFLKDVLYSNYYPLQNYFWKKLGRFPFLPRIKFKKCILSAAQWTINRNILSIDDHASVMIIEEKLYSWMDLWNLPRFLLLTEGDNQILLDRHCKTHIQEIVKKLKNNSTVQLVEKIGQNIKEQWLRSKKGGHFHELVIPFSKNPRCEPARSSFCRSKNHEIKRLTRLKSPGSDWLFTKFYLPKENQEKFLINQLYPFINRFTTKTGCKKWFFIRYLDKMPHLRIRFHADQDEIIQTLIPAVHEFSNGLFENRHIQDLQFGTYDREIERYGGEKLIEFAEDFFCADSEAAIDLLSMISKKIIQLPSYVIAALSLVDLLKGFGCNLEKTTPGILISNLRKEELKGIRDWKKILCNYTNHIIKDNLEALDTDEAKAINVILKKRKHALHLLRLKMEELHESENLYQPLDSIQDSLIHMSCNRLLGVDHLLEHKSRLYANYAIVANHPK